MHSVVKVMVGLSLMFVICNGCKKEQSVSPKVGSLDEGYGILPKPKQPNLTPLGECLNNYGEAVQKLGGTAIPIIAVILQDGTRIDVGGAIVSMVYRVEQSNESLSLFRSIFDVTHLVSGVEHHVWWNVWSRGCYLQRVGDPHYTNLLKGAEVITINSSFNWGVAPYQQMPVSLLVIE